MIVITLDAATFAVSTEQQLLLVSSVTLLG
jgi:hypothetical protein